MKQQTEITPISPVVSLLERDTTLLLQDLVYKASLIEKTIDALLPLPAGKSSRLFEAMRYATLGGGKRLRGYLVLLTAQLFYGKILRCCVFTAPLLLYGSTE